MPNAAYKRVLKNLALSYSNSNEVKIIEFLDQFKSKNLEYSGYIKHILSSLNDSEKNEVLKGNFNTVPSKLMEDKSTVNESAIEDKTADKKSAVEYNSHEPLKKLLDLSQFSDNELLQEITKRGLNYENTELSKIKYNSKTTRIEDDGFGSKVLILIDEDGHEKSLYGDEAQMYYESLHNIA